MAAFEVIALDTATPQLRAPGASDTYTFPRAVEMPLGTANGVLFLNGSKVVTSGSGLTFDGTRLAVNSGATSEALRLNATADTYLSFQRSGTGTAYIQSSTGGMLLWNQENTAIQFGVNNAEQMRLTSTGLGIGTSSPDAKLRVNGGENALQARFSGVSGRGLAISTFVSGGVTDNGVIYNAGLQSDGQQVWQCGGTERMRLDSSGNLGLGVTPSAWTSYKALQISTGASLASIANQMVLGSNWSFDGSDRYVISDFSTLYIQNSGQHKWYTAPSGTAGNAISFTQAMTLDASGNLLLGATNAYRAGRLVVKAANVTQTSATANLHVSTTDAQGINVGGSIGLGGFADTGVETPFAYISGRKENGTAGNYAGYLAFATQDGGATIAERLRLKSTGQTRFIPLAADPAGAEAGDVYYNSGTNKLRLYDGSTWVDLN